MPAQPSLQDIINSIACQPDAPAITPDDLAAALTACTQPNTNEIVGDPFTNLDVPPSTADSLMSCISKMQDLTDSTREASKDTLRISTVRAKVQEVYLNLRFLLNFYLGVNDRFNELIAGYSSATGGNPTSVVDTTNETLFGAVSTFFTQSLSDVSNFSGDINATISGVINQYSPSDIITFTNSSVSINIPSLTSVQVTQYGQDSSGNQTSTLETIPVIGNSMLDPTLFLPIGSINLSFSNYNVKNNDLPTYYKNIENSFLYQQSSGYPGLYWKLFDPLHRLFTLDERGLTLSQQLIDPTLASYDTKPMKEGDAEYFIANYTTFQAFYKDAVKTITDRINNEIDVVFPAAIIDLSTQLTNIGRLYADYIVNGNTSTVVSATEVDANGNPVITYNTILSQGLNSSQYGTQAQQLKDLQTCVDLFSSQVDMLQKKENTITDPDTFTKSLGDISCFPSQTAQNNSGCDVMSVLGSDPLGIKTSNGTNAGYPDITSYCYWLEFTKIMTMVNLMPIPDLSLTAGRIPGITLRYWPIGLMIPTPGPPIKIPLPQIWLPLIVISTPFGVLVLLLAVCGIVPSPFLLFISSSGGKMFLASFKGIGMDGMGFTQNTNGDPVTGIDLSSIAKNGNAGSAIKGALSAPLAVVAEAEQVIRVASELSRTLAGLPGQVLMPNGTPVPLQPGEKVPPQYGPHEIMQQGVDKVKDFDDFVTLTQTKIMKQIDEIGDLEMTSITPIQRKIKTGAKYTPDQLAQAIASEAVSAIGKLKMGSVTFPKDSGKVSIPPLAIQSILTNFKNEASGGFKGMSPDFFDIKKLILKYLTRLNLNLGTTTSFDLTNNQGIKNFRAAIVNANTSIFSALQGNANFKPTGDYKGSITEAARVTEMLSITFAFIAEAGAIELSNPFRNCCSAGKPVSLPQGVAAPVALALLAAEKILEAAINGISDKDLLLLVGGAKQVGIDSVNNVIQSLLRAVPALTLPSSLDVFNINTLLSFITPIFTFLSLPQTPILTVPGIPAQFTIDLDAIIKPIITKIIQTALSDVNIVSKVLPMDLILRFDQISSADIKAILKNQINSAFNDVVAPTKVLFDIIDTLPSKKGTSLSVMDSMVPAVLLKTQLIALAKSLIPSSSLFSVIDTTALAQAIATIGSVLGPLFEFPLSFIIVSAACALPPPGAMLARLLHPVYNQDDLPPWERLVVTNPLLVIFIDEIISKGADSTGLILGRDFL